MIGIDQRALDAAPTSGRNDIQRLIRKGDRLGRIALVTALMAGLSFFSNHQTIALIGVVLMAVSCGCFVLRARLFSMVSRCKFQGGRDVA